MTRAIPGSRLPDGSRAFTLLELMVVVIILGTLMTYVTLRLDGLTASSRLTASARELGASVGVAFSSAVSSGKTRSFNMDLASGEYWVGEAFESPRESAQRVGRLYGGVSFSEVQVGGTVLEGSGVVSMEISPLGIGSECMIRLASEEGRVLSVQVMPLTGTVRYIEGAAEFTEPETE